MSGGQYRRFLLAYGLLPLRKQPYAGMVKLVNTQDLGSCAFACGFESHYPHHVGAKPVPCKLRRLKMSRRIFYPRRLPCLRGRAAGRCCCVAKPDDSTRKRLFRSTRSFPVEKNGAEKVQRKQAGSERLASLRPACSPIIPKAPKEHEPAHSLQRRIPLAWV